MVKIFGASGSIDLARSAFRRIPSPDICSWTSLLHAYARNGCLRHALDVLESMPRRNVVAWTSIVAAFAQHQRSLEALRLFCLMHMDGIAANVVTFTCALDACAVAKDLRNGRKIHASVLMAQGCAVDVALGTSLVNMYGKCGRLDDARASFSDLHRRNVASWTAMIISESDSGRAAEVLDLFHSMRLDCITPDPIAYIYVVDACAQTRSIQLGRIVNAAIVEDNFDRDAFIESALVVMYGRCGKLSDALCAFDMSSCCDVVPWTGMIATLAQSGEGWLALEYFDRMCLQGISPDKVLLSGVIDACASLRILNKARQMHAIMLSTLANGIDLEIKNALLNMYGKAGCLHHARMAFQSMAHKDVCSWNTMIGACLHNGTEEEALLLFGTMQAQGVEPDSISFIYGMTACNYGGWIEKGKKLFSFMVENHAHQQNFDHHFCLIDLLGRAGHLQEAECLVQSILCPEKGVLGWLSLLNACKVHGDVQRGSKAACFCIELDPHNTAPYVLFSNMCHIEDVIPNDLLDNGFAVNGFGV
jgi:pentatricopeptide repeat protein